ncbi:hypothetical protein [Synechococcus sp. GFB01]|uniref:hypothetical protein n=1 Tax=Synechococcus sp. GFB01 TaxID=1662190 RepID=UPI00064FFF99|nr:hypothetical protein [Synechococcus sp. GFB01]KMM16842.1 hypothetical protein SYNGFB01_08370 [Synechococcus sp. GFB01]
MLPTPCRPGAVAVLAVLALLSPTPGRAEDGGQKPSANRPAGLVILQERLSHQGPTAIGVYGVEVDPTTPGLRRVKVWEEQLNNVTVRVDTIRCTPTAPMRVSSDGSRFFLRELNPGGPITAGNRLDHQIWWATCFPEQAGKDPAGLEALARQLGYSGQLRESEQILPGRPR